MVLVQGVGVTEVQGPTFQLVVDGVGEVLLDAGMTEWRASGQTVALVLALARASRPTLSQLQFALKLSR